MCIRVQTCFGGCVYHPTTSIEHCYNWRQCLQETQPGSLRLPVQVYQHPNPCVVCVNATARTFRPQPPPSVIGPQPISYAARNVFIQQQRNRLSRQEFHSWLHTYLRTDNAQRVGSVNGPASMSQADTWALQEEIAYWRLSIQTDSSRIYDAPEWFRQSVTPGPAPLQQPLQMNQNDTPTSQQGVQPVWDAVQPIPRADRNRRRGG